MYRAGVALSMFFVIAAVLPAAAQKEEFNEYWEFRYVSGLPGGGFGVCPEEHRIGFAGAMQQNIPVGYTPGWGNYTLSYHSGATRGGIKLGYRGDDVNGTGTIAFGVGKPERAWWLANMETGVKLESSYNIQTQLRREDAKYPAVSIGVVDLLNRRGTDKRDPWKGGARSFYVVATRESGSPQHPLYISLGIGNGRFNNRPFTGISYDVNKRSKVMVEYDGFQANAAVAFDVLKDKEDWNLIFNFGYADLDRAVVGLTVTHNR